MLRATLIIIASLRGECMHGIVIKNLRVFGHEHSKHKELLNKHAIVQSVWTEVFRNVRFLYKAHIPKKRGTYYTETVYTATVSQAWGKVSLLSSAHSAEWTRNIHSAPVATTFWRLMKFSRRPLQVHLNLPLKGCINAPSIIDHLFILSEFVILMLLVGFCFAVKFKWSIMLGAFIHPFSGKLRCTWRGLLENFINLQKVVATGAEWMFLVHSAEWADDSDTLPQAWLTVAA